MRVLPFSRLGFLGLVLLVAGCGKSVGSKGAGGHALPSPPLVSKSEPGRPGGRFVIAASTSPKTFNPLLAFDGASDGIIRLLFGSLINVNWLTQEPGPGLAESWSVAPDQKTWTFKLRQGLRWSDGQPLTADDVVFTWTEIMYNPEYNQITFGLFHIGGKGFTVSKVDAWTVLVVTPEVFAPFLEFFGGVPILPRHILEAPVRMKKFAGAYGLNTPPQRIVGCGPYRLKEFRPGKFTLLERNPEYWVVDTQGHRLPCFDEVLMLAGGGPGTEAFLFLNGKSDVNDTVPFEAFDQFKQAADTGRFRLVDLGVGADRDILWFNQNTGTNAAGTPLVNPAKLKWFRMKKFRQAVSCAIDRDRIASQVYRGRARAAYGVISTENQKWNKPDVARYAFDPARARALLTEIGIQDRDRDGVLKDADGNRLEILFNSNTGNPAREKAAAMIQEDLMKLGIKLNLTPLDFQELVKKTSQSFDYECALMGLGGGGVDPASQMNVLKSTDELHQWFPLQKTPATDWEARIDVLMDAQMRTLDFTERKKAFDEVQAILAEELPMIYTISPASYAAIRLDVGNVRPSSLTPYRLTWNLDELYFKQK